MNKEQLNRMQKGKGFIAALDQSGGSTPKALLQYGVPENAYTNEKEMFDLVHRMRTRIMTSPAFTSEHILGVILFEQTMDREVEDMPTADYLWEEKQIVPFLKIDKGLAEQDKGVQLMKPMPDLDKLLKRAVEKRIFGTKMRSVIHESNPDGIAEIVKQQFDVAKQIASYGLVPIIEPEVDIHSPNKSVCEILLKENVIKQLAGLPAETKVMFKFTIPCQDNFYADLMRDPHVVRIVALSGGYTQKEANTKLVPNKGLIASFSRALAEGLSAKQSDEQFNKTLANSIEAIYEASIT